MHQLGRLSYEDKVELLVTVDSDTAPDSPLWSALPAATGDGIALRRHRDVAQRLARPLPVSDVELFHQLSIERGQLHRSWCPALPSVRWAGTGGPGAGTQWPGSARSPLP